jgi:hypothetical protein
MSVGCIEALKEELPMPDWISILVWIVFARGGFFRNLLPHHDQRATSTEVGPAWRERINIVALAITIGLNFSPPPLQTAVARDVDGRYADSPLRNWFENLHSDKGPCCSDADGTALSDVDWKTEQSHYLVRIEGQWFVVPDEAVITEPNLSGRTMVWPVYYRELDRLRVDIRCFMPGSMT